MVVGSIGHHDVGGAFDLEKPLGNREYQVWEREVHAAVVLLVGKKRLSIDEMRRAIEGLEPAQYDKFSYYERWGMATATVLMERGTITRGELEALLTPQVDEVAPSAYKVGDIVRVKDEAPHRRWRRPHLRIPGYVHGAVGVVERVVGRFLDPSYVAYRDAAAGMGRPLAAAPAATLPAVDGRVLAQPLYTVRFPLPALLQCMPAAAAAATAVDGAVANAHDELSCDVFHQWLAPASAGEYAAQGAARAEGETDKKQKHGHHGHSHDHDHEHLPRGEVEGSAVVKEGPAAPLQPLCEALIQVLVDKGVLSRGDIRGTARKLDKPKHDLVGPRLVVRAWTDPAFKARLLQDAKGAALELGVQTSNYKTDISLHPAQGPAHAQPTFFAHGHTELIVVENTAAVHNLVVCTLCSCYPTAVLGLSPDWYKSRHYRARAVRDPRGLLKDQFGFVVPRGKRIRVHDSTAEVRYMVLPQRPAGTEGWSEADLLQVCHTDALIGVGEAGDVPAGSPTLKPSKL